jgi:hypothetical protein
MTCPGDRKKLLTLHKPGSFYSGLTISKLERKAGSEQAAKKKCPLNLAVSDYFKGKDLLRKK